MLKTISCAMALLAMALPAHAEFESRDCLILPGASIDLGGAVPGLMSSVDVDVGDSVKAGQIVASLRTEVQKSLKRLTELRATNTSALTAAEARRDYEAAEYERAQSLQSRGVGTDALLMERETALKLRESELEDARISFQEAALDLERAEAELEVRRIRSPIDGVVAQRYLDGGEYLRDDGRVLTIVQLDLLRVEVFLPQAVYLMLAPGDQINVLPELDGGEVRPATVATIDPMIDAASATFRARLLLPNPGRKIVSGVRCISIFPGITLPDG